MPGRPVVPSGPVTRPLIFEATASAASIPGTAVVAGTMISVPEFRSAASA